MATGSLPTQKEQGQPSSTLGPLTCLGEGSHTPFPCPTSRPSSPNPQSPVPKPLCLRSRRVALGSGLWTQKACPEHGEARRAAALHAGAPACLTWGAAAAACLCPRPMQNLARAASQIAEGALAQAQCAEQRDTAQGHSRAPRPHGVPLAARPAVLAKQAPPRHAQIPPRGQLRLGHAPKRPEELFPCVTPEILRLKIQGVFGGLGQ